VLCEPQTKMVRYTLRDKNNKFWGKNGIADEQEKPLIWHNIDSCYIKIAKMLITFKNYSVRLYDDMEIIAIDEYGDVLAANVIDRRHIDLMYVISRQFGVLMTMRSVGHIKKDLFVEIFEREFLHIMGVSHFMIHNEKPVLDVVDKLNQYGIPFIQIGNLYFIGENDACLSKLIWMDATHYDLRI